MKEKIFSIISRLSKKKHCFLTKRGNRSILYSLKLAKDLNKNTVLIPDQGGWITYRQFAEKLKLDVKELKTDHGVIDLDDLKEKADNRSAIIFTDLAGYFAEQPLDDIYKICSRSSCLTIIDNTTISDEKEKPCDIMIGSFGKGKVVDAGFGGFIAVDDEEQAELLKDIVEDPQFDEKQLEELKQKLLDSEQRLKKLFDIHDKVIKELSSFDIIHKDKKGINVIIKGDRDKIIEYCKNNGYEYELCPRYIRVLDDAVSIEIKRCK